MDTPMISEQEIKQYSLIGDNLDGKYLFAAIETAQLQHLMPTVGTPLYERLLSDIDNNTLNESYSTLLNDYVKPFLIHLVLADIIIPIQYKFRNAGMVGNIDDRMLRASKDETDYLQQYYADKAHFYGDRLFDFLIENRTTYPEFLKCQKYNDFKSNRMAGYDCPIYFGKKHIRY